jgi:dTDP-4-dehydrorhamnose reductase
MNKNKTILIFGISGFVGSNLANILKHEYRVIGTYFNNHTKINGILTFRCDLLNKNDVKLLMLTFNPDIVIYAAGAPGINECAENEEYADALNTGGLVNVLEFTHRCNSQLFFISTAHVFSGSDKIWSELDRPDPNTTYGKTMAGAEFFIHKNCLNYKIIRSCKLYGRSNGYRETFFEKMQRSFLRGEARVFDSKVRFGFLDINYLCFVIKELLSYEVKNRIFQLSSSDVMTLHEFGKVYAEIFEEEDSLISSGKLRFPVTKDYSTKADEVDHIYHIDNVNLEGFLDLKMPSIRESLMFTYKNLNGTTLLSQTSDKKTESDTEV